MEERKPVILSFYITSPEKMKVFYRCPVCGTDFRLFESQEHFCHNCGQKIDWKVVTEIVELTSEEEIKEIKDNQAGYIQALDILSTKLNGTYSITASGLKTLFLKLIQGGYIK